MKNILYISFILLISSFTINKFKSEKPVISTQQDEQTYSNTDKPVPPMQCTYCHAKNSKLVGPSFVAIANRYNLEKESTLTYLKSKITAGSKNVWGEYSMMPPQKLNKKELTNFILYLRSIQMKK